MSRAGFFLFAAPERVGDAAEQPDQDPPDKIVLSEDHFSDLLLDLANDLPRLLFGFDLCQQTVLPQERRVAVAVIEKCLPPGRRTPPPENIDTNPREPDSRYSRRSAGP